VTCQWFGFGQLRVHEAIEAAELVEHDCTHDFSPSV
jgi:hypothetical protein